MSDSSSSDGVGEHSTHVHPSDTVAEYNGRSRDAAIGQLVSELRRSPELVHDRNFVVERAVAEFTSLSRQMPELSAREYCQQFAAFGRAIESSIARQFELERFLEQFPGIAIRKLARWPVTGDCIGEFEILEELGRGGLSRVYLCRQREIGGRQVVVKLGSSAFEEAHTLGQLRHPNIVPIHSTDFEASSGRAMLCMPFLGRSTLYNLVDLAFGDACPKDEGILLQAARAWHQPSDQMTDDAHHLAQPRFTHYHECVAYIGGRLADALAHAHAQHVVHGDLKPSNVLLSHRGEPLLMDFNLSGNATLEVSARGGTLPYMPPEQVRLILGAGNENVYDERSDIYSLGAVLYELLTGHSPYQVTDANAVQSTIASEILRLQGAGCKPLRSIDPTISVTLARTVERCLETAPERRFQTAEQARVAFDGEMCAAVRRRRWIASRRSAWAPAASLGLALVALAGTFFAVRTPLHVRMLDRGKDLFQAGDFVSAESYFSGAVALSPNYDDARFELGRALLRQRKIDDALEEFTSLTLTQERARDLAYVAYCFSLQGRFTVALAWYERAARANCRGPEFHNNRAVAYLDGRNEHSPEDRRSGAERDLLLALREDPKSPSIRLNWIRHKLSDPRTVSGSAPSETVQFAIDLANEFPNNGIATSSAATAIAFAAKRDDRLLAEGAKFLVLAIRLGAGPSRYAFLNAVEWREFRESQAAPAILAAFSSSGSLVGEEIPRLLEPVSLCEDGTSAR